LNSKKNHFIPKYFELYLRNVEGPTTECNGDVKDGHLCSGEGCAKEDDFKDFNCADAVKTVNPTSGDYLKPGLPFWEIFVYCNDGLYPLCEEPEVWEGSAEIKIDYTEVNPTGLILRTYQYCTNIRSWCWRSFVTLCYLIFLRILVSI